MCSTDNSLTASQPVDESTGPKVLLPLIGVVFMLYLVIGLAMPVLPLYVHNDLGFDTFIVGLVVGSQFAVAVFSRTGAGLFVDRKGVKQAVVLGLLVAACAGALCIASTLLANFKILSISLLVLGRFLLGAGENLVITGSLCWGMTMLGPNRSGQVMAWIGTAIFGALAVSTPLGNFVYESYHFEGVAIVSFLIPLLALPLIYRLASVPPPPRNTVSIKKVIGAVWMPGVSVALSGFGYGAVTTFITLLFVKGGWVGVWIVLSALSVSFMVGRLCLGHLPDKIGGAKVALVCVLIESVGQGLIWIAQGPLAAIIGVTLTGLGYSLVYPALGVESLRRVVPEHRGLAMATYTVFLDISLGMSGPVLGWIAGRSGLESVYLVSMIVALCATVMIVRLLKAPCIICE
ncbi:arabinose transporter [Maridesulfovibrio bastinii]|uniref:arabinose transporter n=1 Tax=Maridesulfovibrio bastinii TaxID=47157 RepID=UPI0004151E2B|nr:arabinose transporter [Maridesulfovibrio bastinii]